MKIEISEELLKEISSALNMCIGAMSTVPHLSGVHAKVLAAAHKLDDELCIATKPSAPKTERLSDYFGKVIDGAKSAKTD